MSGLSYDPNGKSDEDICLHYVNYKRRLISKRARRVLLAKEFSLGPAGKHACGITLIQERFEQGDDLTPHLHEEIFDPAFKNAFFFDWGIYHLHLGTVTWSKEHRLVGRTGPLLVVRVDSDAAYFISIISHDKDPNLLGTDPELLEIIHRDWPATIARYKFPGRGKRPTTEADIRCQRGISASFLYTLQDGTAYNPPGGSVAASGDSTDAVDLCDQLRMALINQQGKIIANIDAIRQDALTKGTPLPSCPEFTVKLQDDKFVIYEKASGYICSERVLTV